MKLTNTLRRPTGILSLSAIDRSGRHLWSETLQNLIVDTGYTALLEALAGVEGAAIDRFAIGTNGTPPNHADTAITNGQTIAIASVEYPEQNRIRFHFTVGYDQGNGTLIREFGLITADGRLFSRRTRAGAIEKSESMALVGTWDIII
jgi:hypothetical protein